MKTKTLVRINAFVSFLVVVTTLLFIGSPAIAQDGGGSQGGSPRIPTFGPPHSTTVSVAKAASVENVAQALNISPELVKAASWGSSDPAGAIVFAQHLADFPTEGNSFLAISSGDAQHATLPNNNPNLSTILGGLNNSQGNDLVQLSLTLKVPEGANYWSVDWQFMSEEYPEFVGSYYNDAFLIETPTSNFTISGNTVNAPNNQAFDTHSQLVSINTTGAVGMSEANALGTTYDGATTRITTSVPIPCGTPQIDIVFSVMDLGDSVYDTAVFLDNFRFADGPDPAWKTILVAAIESTMKIKKGIGAGLYDGIEKYEAVFTAMDVAQLTDACLPLVILEPTPASEAVCAAAFLDVLSGNMILQTIKLFALWWKYDPPDPNYTELAQLRQVEPTKPYDDSEVAAAWATYLTGIDRQNAIMEGYIISFERLQGAIIDENLYWSMEQARAAATFLEMLNENQQGMIGILADYSTEFESFSAERRDEFYPEMAELIQWGFDEVWLDALTDLGFGQGQINSVNQILLDLPVVEDFDVQGVNGLREWEQLIPDFILPELGVLYVQLSETVDELESVYQDAQDNQSPLFDVPPSPTSGTEFITQVSSSFGVSVQASDPDPGDIVTVDAIDLPTGATFTPIPGNPASGTLSWKPSAGQEGVYVIPLGAVDDKGMPSAPLYVVVVVEPAPADIQTPDTPELSSPKDGRTTTDTTPKFAWGKVKGATLYRLQVSTDPLFGSTVLNTTSDRTNYSVPDVDALAFGRYWWRVQAQNELGNWGEWSLVSMFELTLLKLPSNAQHLEDLTPTFRWNKTSGATQYRFQVATDSGFGTLVFNEVLPPTQSSFVPASDMAMGQYWWRVRAQVNGVWSAWMPAWTFTVTPPPPDRPDLLSPAKNSELTTSTPQFEWSTVSGGHYYQLQIDDNSNFKSPVLDVTLAPGVLSFTPVAPLPDGGNFYWRVRAMNALGVAGKWGSGWKFTLTMIDRPDLLTPPKGAVMTNTTPTLTWAGVTGSDSYQVEIASDSKFAYVVQSGTAPGTTYGVNPLLPDGKFYWRVRGVTGAGVPGRWSRTFYFTVDTTGPDAPVLRKPIDGDGTNDATPKLEWDKVKDAAQYRVQVAEDDSFTVLEIDAVESSSRHVVPDTEALDYGIYYWQVQASDVLGNVGPWSRTGRFAVTLHRSPDDQGTTTDTTPQFSWNSASGALAYQFQLDDDADFNNPEATYTGTSRSYTPEALPNGVYHWRVRVETAGGWSDWMPVWTVTVSAILPDRPVPTGPANKLLTNDNTPTLTWTGVADAVSYEVRIDDDSRFRTPEQAVTVGGTQYIASALPDGRWWYWQVRAVNSVGAPGKWSKTWRFEVDTVPPDVPVLVAPLDNASSTNKKLRLDWDRARDADNYELWLYPAGSDPNLPPIDMDRKTDYTPAIPLSYGPYEWRVRAVDKAGNASEWSETRAVLIVAGVTAPETTPVPTDVPTIELPDVPTVQPTAEPTALPPDLMTVEAESGLLRLEGPWTAAQSQRVSSGQYLLSSGRAGDAVSLKFEGERVDVVYVQNAALGRFVIQLDGADVIAVDSTQARGDDFTASLTLSVSPGVHVLRIVAVEGVVGLDAFRVAPQAITLPEPPTPPTEEPTEEPTAEPTVEPTVEPTAESTVEPTEEPTAEPTAEATAEPTAEPTEESTPDIQPPPIQDPATDRDG